MLRLVLLLSYKCSLKTLLHRAISSQFEQIEKMSLCRNYNGLWLSQSVSFFLQVLLAVGILEQDCHNFEAS